MSKLQDAPITEPVVERDGRAKPAWVLFFNALIRGDNGSRNVPNGFVPNGLGAVGTPVINTAYFQNNGFADFYINIVPGTSTSSTAGTTYFTLPFDVIYDAPCFAVTGTTSSVNGVVQASTNRCYPPNWTGITTPITISGRVKIA